MMIDDDSGDQGRSFGSLRPDVANPPALGPLTDGRSSTTDHRALAHHAKRKPHRPSAVLTEPGSALSLDRRRRFAQQSGCLRCDVANRPELPESAISAHPSRTTCVRRAYRISDRVAARDAIDWSLAPPRNARTAPDAARSHPHGSECRKIGVNYQNTWY